MGEDRPEIEKGAYCGQQSMGRHLSPPKAPICQLHETIRPEPSPPRFDAAGRALTLYFVELVHEIRTFASEHFDSFEQELLRRVDACRFNGNYTTTKNRSLLTLGFERLGVSTRLYLQMKWSLMRASWMRSSNCGSRMHSRPSDDSNTIGNRESKGTYYHKKIVATTYTSCSRADERQSLFAGLRRGPRCRKLSSDTVLRVRRPPRPRSTTQCGHETDIARRTRKLTSSVNVISGMRRYDAVATGENFAWSLPMPRSQNISISISYIHGHHPLVSSHGITCGTDVAW